MTPDALTRERPFLFGLAYRLLGSAADAEDALQEAWLRVADVDDARSERALLATVVTRICLDETRSARRRRETYVGPWLPEPLLTETVDGDAVEQAESISVAFLVLLESLSPLERAVFVLREVLDFDFAEVADAVGRSEAACRQLLHRAKDRLADRPSRFAVDPSARDALTVAFLSALSTGDAAALVGLLADDVTAVTDHGGRASAARRIVTGADAVSRFFAGLVRKASAEVSTRVCHINGALALVVCEGGRVTTVIQPAGDVGGRVAAVYVTRNPDKLARLDAALRG